MELCTGGSLYEVIDSPENSYGLCETEFKQVIYDVGESALLRLVCRTVVTIYLHALIVDQISS